MNQSVKSSQSMTFISLLLHMKEMSYKDLANKSGISERTIKRYVKEGFPPGATMDRIYNVSKVLDVCPGMLSQYSRLIIEKKEPQEM